MLFQNLSEYYAQSFREGRLTLESIGKVVTFREVLVAIYWELVSEKKIVMIEELEMNDKMELWQEAMKTGLSKNDRIRFCKAVWALNNLL